MIIMDDKVEEKDLVDNKNLNKKNQVPKECDHDFIHEDLSQIFITFNSSNEYDYLFQSRNAMFILNMIKLV